MSNFNFNKIMLGGRLTADPENRQTSDGISVTSFTLAVSRCSPARDGGKPMADFFKIIAWRSLADFAYKFFRRGSAMFVVGTVQNRSYIDPEGTKRYVTEIVADEIHFVDSKSEGINAGADRAAAGRDNSAESTEKPAPFASSYCTAEDFAKSGDDDLPF